MPTYDYYMQKNVLLIMVNYKCFQGCEHSSVVEHLPYMWEAVGLNYFQIQSKWKYEWCPTYEEMKTDKRALGKKHY